MIFCPFTSPLPSLHVISFTNIYPELKYLIYISCLNLDIFDPSLRHTHTGEIDLHRHPSDSDRYVQYIQGGQKKKIGQRQTLSNVKFLQISNFHLKKFVVAPESNSTFTIVRLILLNQIYHLSKFEKVEFFQIKI